MKVVHLIMAHNQPLPAQMARFINRLRHPDAIIYVHIDKKFPVEEFNYFFADYKDVHFIRNRVKVSWATYSMIDATLASFKEILTEQKDFDYLNLLSGQDYLLKPINQFHAFLAQHPRKAFMHALDVYKEWQEAISRVEEYHLDSFNIPGKYAIQNWVNKIMPKRKMPGGMIPVGRSQWFTIAKEHVVYIVEELARNKDFVHFFKLSWAPDEMVFQTLLYNSSFKDDIVNDNLRYIDWSEGKKNPKTFTIDDIGPIMQSGKFFARKFNSTLDAKVLDEIDRRLDAQEV